MSMATARLYLCTDARTRQGDFADFVDAAFAGGVDIIQLRDKALEGAEQLELLGILAEVADRHGRLWSANDRADIARVTGAPVLHLGQKDLPERLARTVVGPHTVIGLSTHTPEQVDAAAEADGLDYFCVGPVWATPTKPGRAAVGTGLVRHAASIGTNRPWFAIGGIDLTNIDEVVAAGAERVVVVRAITESDDPSGSARRLREALPAVVPVRAS
ncbi:thiamine phosphate synthase [Microbacterium sp. LWS13-1.2]|uniref:Thiamine-phosphate synthase n=1 Tax=Microbacterium sp. LWS13-1.2 TaxID=3135264 RepID=A0AAU6SEA2_9MICO